MVFYAGGFFKIDQYILKKQDHKKAEISQKEMVNYLRFCMHAPAEPVKSANEIISSVGKQEKSGSDIAGNQNYFAFFYFQKLPAEMVDNYRVKDAGNINEPVPKNSFFVGAALEHHKGAD